MQITFFQDSIDDATTGCAERIREYVKRLPETDFEAADAQQMSEMIAARFRFPDMPEFATGPIERDDPVFTQGSERAAVTVYFPYKGDVSLFRLYHRSRPLSPAPPTFEVDRGMLIKKYVIDKRRLEQVDQLVEEDLKLVQQYSEPLRSAAPLFNEHLLRVAQEAVNNRVRELNENKQAVAKLSKSKLVLRKRADGTESIIVPVQRKPIPVARSPVTVDPVREYVLGISEYDDILKTVSSMVKVMERTPSVFAEMNEEPLRTILLVALNGVYEGQATGETFNGKGKTDILIRRDDRNVFIAECLIWKGQAYLQRKMDEQLFQYAMWRDSKLALIVFNRGGNFTHTIETMKATIKAHPQCINQMGWTHESGARYLFRRHDDPARQFLLTAVAFDVPSEG